MNNACVRHLGNEKKNEFFFYIPFGLHYLCTVFQERITHCTENSVRKQTWAPPQYVTSESALNPKIERTMMGQKWEKQATEREKSHDVGMSAI